ncbi:MAG: Trk system potassium transport protein TrkA [Chloroflexota bacterium]|jgi:trk system potassium uptake protein TrkA|nr:Trk system potassium transporter TrkA [Caldilinea sp.]GIK71902.1 MAG: Trk system potassium transport protein TrkA [Chloroflexota bacterium]
MRILIIGAGDVGFQLGKRLSRDQHDITIIDANPDKVRRAAEQLDGLAIEGTGDSYQVLLQAGVREADVVAAVTDNDDANLMACRLAKASGVEVTIARVRNAEFTSPDFPLTPNQLGADHIIHPEREAANAILRLLQESSATHVIDLENGKIEVIGLILEPDSPLVGPSLAELGARHHRPPVQIVAVERNHETIIPKGNDRLYAGDLLFAVCAPEYAKEFFGLAGKRKKPRMDNIMILGGGMVARFIAEELSGRASIKIIEHDFARAERLAGCLPQTLVIHGDGTDLDLLQAEDIDEMDAFVAVTGDDENNIIATLLALQHDVTRPIALVNRVAYLPILPKIGLNAVISKQMLTVNAVQQFIQHRQVAAIASLPGIEGQMIEYIAREGARITQKPLRSVKFPRAAVVGAVLRNGTLLIPDGDTVIRPGDRTVIFTLPEALNELDRLFG